MNSSNNKCKVSSQSSQTQPMRMNPSPPLTIVTTTIIIIISLLASFGSPATQSSLSMGSSLSSEDESDILISPNKAFSCGFNKVGSNAFTFSIWFSNSADRALVWTANRDRPVNGRGSRIEFRKDGSVALTDVDGTVVWATNTSSTDSDRAQLLDTGNLVVMDPGGKIQWQSFDSPTDTLLPTQPITKSKKLISSASNGAVSSGYYSFYFDNDNVLRLIYDGPEISSIYWPNPDYDVWQNGRTKYNSSRFGVLDESGRFTASDRLTFNASDTGPGIRRRLTLDYDGNLRLYSLDDSNRTWSISWVALPRLYLVHGLCGRNGICGQSQSETFCSCPPHYEMSDTGDWSKGCKPRFSSSCDNTRQFKFVQLPKSDFWGFDLNRTLPVSLRDCKELCRRDCSCEGISYKMGTGDCYTKSALFNGRSSPDNPSTVYLKIPNDVREASRLSVRQANDLVCNSSEAGGVSSSAITYGVSNGRTKWVYFYGFISAFGAIEILFIATGWWFIFRRERKPTSLEKGYKLISSQFRRFTYKELKIATGKFKDELGRGGSGAVYKGVLEDDRVVAVKKLEDVIQGEEEFWAEVSVIGSIYHMNLVRMWGFCFESSYKLLVYEFIDNGSLDKLLFSKSSLLGWSDRFKIAVGVAKGLAYLHHECLEWVIHCDVKPENILLGADFEPKIADFGLAKLSKRGGPGSNLSRIRGTRGYLAPEWVSNLPITAKVDVYSYGVVLLELVKGVRVSDWVVDGDDGGDDAELVRFVRMVKLRLESRSEDSWVGDFVDSRLDGEFNSRQAAMVVEIAVSCLEEERSRRPTMDSILQMLLSSND